MIHESAPWKDSLARDADLIDRWAAKPKITERRSILIERKVFLAAYSMRKLLQAGKLSSSFSGRSIPCYAAQLVKGKKIDQLNVHRYAELYDINKMARQVIAAPTLLDLLIHSLLFSEATAEDGTVTGFFVTSDRNRSTLWLVDIKGYTKLLRQVASDYPNVAHWARNPETGEYVEWKGDREPTEQVRAKMHRVVKSSRSSRG